MVMIMQSTENGSKIVEFEAPCTILALEAMVECTIQREKIEFLHLLQPSVGLAALSFSLYTLDWGEPDATLLVSCPSGHTHPATPIRGVSRI